MSVATVSLVTLHGFCIQCFSADDWPREGNVWPVRYLVPTIPQVFLWKPRQPIY